MERMESELTFEELKLLREAGQRQYQQQQCESTTTTTTTTAAEPTAAPESPVSSGTDVDSSPTESQGYGVLRGWFPGWSGWYGGGQSTAAEGTAADTVPSPADLVTEADGGNLSPDGSTATVTEELEKAEELGE